MIRATIKSEATPDEIALNAKRVALDAAAGALADSADAVEAVEAAANLTEAQDAVDGLGATIADAQGKVSGAQAV